MDSSEDFPYGAHEGGEGFDRASAGLGFAGGIAIAIVILALTLTIIYCLQAYKPGWIMWSTPPAMKAYIAANYQWTKHDDTNWTSYVDTWNWYCTRYICHN